MHGDGSDGGFSVVFESLGSAAGIDVIDPIERRRRSFHTPGPVDPTPADADRFPFPVETAIAIETQSLSMPTAEQVIVRDADGQMIEEVEHGDARSFPDAEYVLEPTGIVRTYVRVDGGLSIGPDGHATVVDFGASTRVAIGSRSPHERPAATVQITPEPAGVLAAISTFGSALKTTSPERAFGSFRGHPPAIEVGEERSIPDGLEPPADDLHLEVPAEYRYALPVAPLAYYLGCPVQEGPEPRLVGDGLEHRLEGDGLQDRPDADGSFEAGVRRTLERIFLLECVVRTDGIYRVDLHEREVLEERVDLESLVGRSMADLYEAPQSERIRAFLDVPHDLIADLVPDWHNAAHVAADVESVEALPYLVDDLAHVRVAEPEPVSSAVVESGGVQGLLRGGGADAGAVSGGAAGSEAAGGDASGWIRGGGTRDGPGGDTATVRGGSAAADTTFVNLAGDDVAGDVDAREETWVGEGTPVGATKAVTQAYRNRIGRTPTTGDIDISVICNADAMAEEGDVVESVYGSRADLPFDVTVHRDLTVEELADVLAEERDFLHYVGHIEDEGIECDDGLLDVGTLEHVGTDAFFLNACQSYEQGVQLIEAGAIGGIVTIRDVVNHGAVRIGRVVARLLDNGFPLRASLELAREESVVGSLYTVVGDGGLSIVQSEGGTPLMLHAEPAESGYRMWLDFYGAETGLGGVTHPHTASNDQYYLASGTSRTFEVDAAELAEFAQVGNSPLVYDGTLEWSDGFEL
jgi:CBS domain-containing protein